MISVAPPPICITFVSRKTRSEIVPCAHHRGGTRVYVTTSHVCVSQSRAARLSRHPRSVRRDARWAHLHVAHPAEDLDRLRRDQLHVGRRQVLELADLGDRVLPVDDRLRRRVEEGARAIDAHRHVDQLVPDHLPRGEA